MTARRRTPSPPLLSWIFNITLGLVVHTGEECEECVDWIHHYTDICISDSDSESLKAALEARNNAVEKDFGPPTMLDLRVQRDAAVRELTAAQEELRGAQRKHEEARKALKAAEDSLESQIVKVSRRLTALFHDRLEQVRDQPFPVI